MSNYTVNTDYFQHSTPEYNKKHREQISKYNHQYYLKNKEKWKDNEEAGEGSEETEGTEKLEGLEAIAEKYKGVLSKLRGGSKTGGTPNSKKKDAKTSSESKSGTEEKDSDEETQNTKSSKTSQRTQASQTDEQNEGQESSSPNKDLYVKYKKLRYKVEKSGMESLTDEERKELEEVREAMRKLRGQQNKAEIKAPSPRTSSEIKSRIPNREDFKEKSDERKQELQKKIEERRKALVEKRRSMKHSAVYVGVNSQPYFQHHGRLGMKWGKRNGPPYPLDYSKLSEEERAKDKQRVKEEGDIESVGYKKNRSYFTDQEINEVINRYQLNTRINQLSSDSAKMKAGKSKTQELADNMAKVADVGFKLSNAINAGTNVYNNVAKIMNAFGDADLPIVGQQKQDKPKEFKFTDKDYESVVKDLGKYTTKELQSINQRKAAIDQISKTQRDAKEKKDNETKEAAQKLVDEYNNRLVREAEEAARFESGKYRIRR